MRKLVETSLPSGFAWLAIVLALLLAIAVGPLVQILRVGVRELVIFFLTALILLVILLPSQRVLRFGFILWILTFALGWRSVYLTRSLNIHPTEVVAAVLFIAVLSRSIVSRVHLNFSLPMAVPFFSLFALAGISTALQNGRPLDLVFEELKIFLVIPLAIYLVRWSIHNQTDWERAARWAVGVAVYLSVLGLTDLFFPSFSRAISGGGEGSTQFISTNLEGDTFTRAVFIFFGSPTAGFVISTFLGFTIYECLKQFRRSENAHGRVLALVILVIVAAGIYLSGYRGLWYAIVLFIAIYALFERRMWGLIVGGVFFIPYLPVDFLYRFQSVFDSQYADSSQWKRLGRALNAWDLFTQSPIAGWGWGGSGYVHSDLLQIAANLGIFGFLFFTAWIFGILWRLYPVTRRTDWARDHARIMFAMICSVLFIFAGEGFIVFPQLAVPVWFLFAMAQRLTELAQNEGAFLISGHSDLKGGIDLSQPT